MTDLDDLNTYHDGSIPAADGVPYMAEGHHIAAIMTDGEREFVVTDGGRRDTCRFHHDWSKVPEGEDPSYVCWNCDAVKFPVEVLTDD